MPAPMQVDFPGKSSHPARVGQIRLVRYCWVNRKRPPSNREQHIHPITTPSEINTWRPASRLTFKTESHPHENFPARSLTVSCTGRTEWDPMCLDLFLQPLRLPIARNFPRPYSPYTRGSTMVESLKCRPRARHG
jgi:hypothetical protein